MSLTRKTVFGCKQETIQGTAVALATSDFLLCDVVDLKPSVALIERDHLRASISKLEHISGKKMLDVTVRTEFKWSGVAGTSYAPLAALLQAAGNVQTVNSGAEAIGSASASPNNLGVSPAPVLTIAAPDFAAVSGKFTLTLISKVTTNPEGAVFSISFQGNDGSDAITDTFTVTDTDFAGVAADGSTDIADHIELTVNDPDGGGAGDPVTSWHVGDTWSISYTSAVQVNCVYAPTSTTATNFYGPGKSITAQVWLDGPATGISHIAKGALVSSARLSQKAGELGYWEFTIRGLWSADPADASFPATSYMDTLPAILQSANMTMQSSSLCAANFELGIENDIAEIECATAVAGLQGFMITGRTVTGKADPQILAVATHPFIKRFLDGTSMAFAASWKIETGGSTPQKITLAENICQYTTVTPGDRNGIRTMQLEWGAKGSTGGDDEFSITIASA